MIDEAERVEDIREPFRPMFGLTFRSTFRDQNACVKRAHPYR